MMELSFKVCALAAAVSLLGACGGSSGGSGTSGGDTIGGGTGGGGDPAPNSLQGQFVDAPVANIAYSTAPSGLSGRTDANGFFDYQPGDTVTFSVRGKDLPTVPATGVVSIASFDIVSTDDSPDLGLNIAILLQTLDSDGDPNNGLEIPEETAETATLAAGVDFNQSSSSFVAAAETLAALTDGDGPLVTADAAGTHLGEQLKALLTSNGGQWRMYTVGPGTDDLSQFVTFGPDDATIGEVYVGGWNGRSVNPFDGQNTAPYQMTARGFIPEVGFPETELKLIYRGTGSEGPDAWDVLIFADPEGGYAYYDNRQTGLFDVGNFSVSEGDTLSLLGDEGGGALYANLTFAAGGGLSVTGGADVGGSFGPDTGAWRNDVNASEVFINSEFDPADPITGVGFDPEDTETVDSLDFLLPVSPGEVTLFAHSIKQSPTDGAIEEDYMLGSSNAELMEQIRNAAISQPLP